MVLFTRAMIVLARELAQRPAEARVTAFLQGLELAGTQTAYDFDLDPPPRALDTDGLHFLARVSAELATRLASGLDHRELSELFMEDRAQRARWAAWAADFTEMASAALPADKRVNAPWPELQTSREQLVFERARIHHRLSHLEKLGNADTQTLYGLAAREVELYERHRPDEHPSFHQWQLAALERRAELGAQLGHLDEAATDYERAADLVTDEEGRELLLSLAQAARDGSPIL